jgi:ubiquinone/menaquinone biosynthesis C-methylase UbiE
MSAIGSLKPQVKEHWEQETCGTRYGDAQDRRTYFSQITTARYELEPYLPAFAGFSEAGGKRVLEIGVGAGSDFQNWCAHALHVTGVDLTEGAINLTRERLELNSISPSQYSLRTADAENLPFPDNSFDLVYSWGVLHHTPDTRRAFQEVMRVLKPGGAIKAMIYHVPSWVGLLLYLSHGIARGRVGLTMKGAIFDHLESPGTKAYTLREAEEMVRSVGLREIELRTELSPGDLLRIRPSAKYQGLFSKLMWKVYPRWVVKALGDRFGLYLLIEAQK